MDSTKLFSNALVVRQAQCLQMVAQALLQGVQSRHWQPLKPGLGTGETEQVANFGALPTLHILQHRAVVAGSGLQDPLHFVKQA